MEAEVSVWHVLHSSFKAQEICGAGFFTCNPAVDLPVTKRDPLSVEYDVASAANARMGAGGSDGGGGGGMFGAPACLTCAPAAGGATLVQGPSMPTSATHAEPLRARL